jgi:hypothetical protein
VGLECTVGSDDTSGQWQVVEGSILATEEA